jgi:deoxyribodipyrimidine photo-lyase
LIQRERVRPLNNEVERDRDFVLYWMQAAQRAEDNHALEYAIDRANARQKPLIVFFGLTESFPEANERHYAFMLEGLAETAWTLQKRGIQLVSRRIPPETGAIELARRSDLVVVDRGYLRIERAWRESVAGAIDCPLIQVETNAVVPLEQASPREEWAARTIRPKIKRQLAKYLVPLRARRMKKDSLGLAMDSFDVSDAGRALGQLDIERSVICVSAYTGGTSEAKRRLADFIAKKLSRYPEMRNDPNADAISHMSPYLHFGQISPLYIALEVVKSRNEAADVYLEELIVRRELSLNFVQFNTDYDQFAGLPQWAQKTLEEHGKDRRQAIYSPAELEGARTGDPYWNAAQREMALTGKMHNYMRMYWGKRIIEWTAFPEEAFRLALYLNNRYEIDGRDPNSFAGVAWCFGKHDRAWPSRPVFGKVRSMTASGLRRKFDADAYARKYEVSHGAIR